MATIPMFAPNGQTGDVPVENIQKAQAAGFKAAYDMVAPDGKSTGYVPEDQAAAAQQKGFRFSNFSQNPKLEGTYPMWDTAGHRIGVPYSMVPSAQGEGYKFDANANKSGLTPAQQFAKDEAADPNRTGGTSMMMAPAGARWTAPLEPQSRQESLQRLGQAETDAPLPMRVLTGMMKGGATVARPAIDVMNLGENGNTPAEQSYMMEGRTPAETAAKLGTIGAAITPAVVAAPVSTVLGLGGAQVAGYGGSAAADAMGADPKVSAVVGDVTGLAGGIAAGSATRIPVVANAAARMAPKLYESALKPSTTLGVAERAGITQTALQNEIPVSQQGLRNIGDLIGDLNQKIKNVVAADPTRPIDPNAVATRVDQLAPRMASQVNAGQDLSNIEAVKQQFLQEQGARPGQPAVAPRPTGVLDAQGNPVMTPGTPATPPQPAPPMSAADAQAMKQGTYRALGDKNYGELQGATVEAQKALARGLKEEIANQFPELDSLNQAESKLLDLQPVLERAVNRISNHQLIGIGTPIAGAAASALSGSGAVGGITAFMKMILDDPMVKSRLAIQLSHASKIPPAEAFQKVAAYSSSLGAATGVAAADRTGPGGQPNFYSDGYLRSKAAFDAAQAAGKSKEAQ